MFWSDGEFEERERKAFEAIKKTLSKELNINAFLLDDIAKMRGGDISFDQLIDRVMATQQN